MCKTEDEALYNAFAKAATEWRFPLSEAAMELGVTAATLRQQIANGSLKPAGKIGPMWTVTKDEIERYRRENLRSPH